MILELNWWWLLPFIAVGLIAMLETFLMLPRGDVGG
jgi:hypothetical protein